MTAVRDVNDESVAKETRIVCTLGDGADERSTISQLLDLWPVSVERTAHLTAPLGRLVRDAVDDDRVAQADALAQLRWAISIQ